MRVLKQDPITGDMIFGSGNDFYVNSPEGVAQCVLTALRLLQGEWFLNLLAGLPLSTEILGYGTASTYDPAIKAVILGVEGVTEIVSYSSVVENRKLIVSGVQVMTLYSEQPVAIGGIGFDLAQTAVWGGFNWGEAELG